VAGYYSLQEQLRPRRGISARTFHHDDVVKFGVGLSEQEALWAIVKLTKAARLFHLGANAGGVESLKLVPQLSGFFFRKSSKKSVAELRRTSTLAVPHHIAFDPLPDQEARSWLLLAHSGGLRPGDSIQSDM
jgi:hypothetical protein